MQEQKREFTGVWIPRHIIEDENLTMTDKIIFAEIACFDVCYKSNEKLGERYGLKRNTIMKIVLKLEAMGYIERKSFDGRQRQLKAKMDKPNHSLHVNIITPCIGKESHPACENNHTIDNTLEHRKENILQTDVCEVVSDLLKDNKKHIQIIGLYAKAKKVEFENKEQQQSFIKRNLRASNDLIGYNFKRIVDTMNYLMLNADFKWTLESVAKYIDEDTNKLKSNQSEEDEIKSFFDKY